MLPVPAQRDPRCHRGSTDRIVARKASALGITIEDLKILPDYVHLFISASPSYAPQHLVYYFKRYTSHVLRAEFPALKTSLSSLWTRSYYVASVGYIAEDAIQQYIEQQKRR